MASFPLFVLSDSGFKLLGLFSCHLGNSIQHSECLYSFIFCIVFSILGHVELFQKKNEIIVKFFFNYIYLCRGAMVCTVKEQLTGISSLLVPCGPWNWTEGIKLDCSHLFSLSHVAGHKSIIFQEIERMFWGSFDHFKKNCLIILRLF